VTWMDARTALTSILRMCGKNERVVCWHRYRMILTMTCSCTCAKEFFVMWKIFKVGKVNLFECANKLYEII
jgi:hypothetical protein